MIRKEKQGQTKKLVRKIWTGLPRRKKVRDKLEFSLKYEPQGITITSSPTAATMCSSRDYYWFF
jgi:hypothetical protein